MYKFFIASDKQISASKPENTLPGTVDIYMVKRKAVPLPFKEIIGAMEETFESLTINKHRYGYWFNIEIEELQNKFGIIFVERSFELKKEQFKI